MGVERRISNAYWELRGWGAKRKLWSEWIEGRGGGDIE